MSKYKVGDKFIINIKEVLESEKGTLYRANYNTLAFDDYGLDGLQKYDALQERLELIEELKKAEYNKGLNDAWELLKKVAEMPNNKICEHILEGDSLNPLRAMANCLTPQEALAKLKAYEDSKIEVGDVVKFKDMEKTCVISTVSKNGYLVIFKDGSGGTIEFPRSAFDKTGKHIDIKSFLEQIGE